MTGQERPNQMTEEVAKTRRLTTGGHYGSCLVAHQTVRRRHVVLLAASGRHVAMRPGRLRLMFHNMRKRFSAVFTLGFFTYWLTSDVTFSQLACNFEAQRQS